MLISPFIYSFYFSLCLSVCKLFFIKDFPATTWVRTLQFGTKLDSDELYCVTKRHPHTAYQSLYFSFFFLSNGISVTDFSAPIGASVFKFCVHPQEGTVHCVNGNKDANPHFAFFFQFSFSHSYIIHMDIFSVNVRILKFGIKLDSD